MLVLAMHTGLRVSELTGLDVGLVSLDGAARSVLFVPASIAKGGHERLVPLNRVAQGAVEALLRFNRARGFSVAAAAPLFVTRKHQRISVRLVQRLVQGLRERAGLAVPATPHTLRHGFATEVLNATGNVRIVQQLLGHQRLGSTQRYTHPSRAALEQAVAAIAGGAACK
jgi:site-specific recombinase XerD